MTYQERAAAALKFAERFAAFCDILEEELDDLDADVYYPGLEILRLQFDDFKERLV